MQTYYELLGVPEDASEAEIEAAFKSKAREVHPDKVAPENPYLRKVAAEAFKDLSEAKSVLLDSNQRQKYDAGLAYMRGAPSSSTPPAPQPSSQAPPPPKTRANPGSQNQAPPSTPPQPSPTKQSFWGPPNTPLGSIALTAGGVGCLLLLGGIGFPGLAFVSLSFALLCWRHGMRPGTDPKVLGGSVFLFIFAVMFFAGWIESPSSNPKQTNSTPSQGATPSALPAPITTVPCGKTTTEACASTPTPNKLAGLLPQPKAQIC